MYTYISLCRVAAAAMELYYCICTHRKTHRKGTNETKTVLSEHQILSNWLNLLCGVLRIAVVTQPLDATERELFFACHSLSFALSFSRNSTLDAHSAYFPHRTSSHFLPIFRSSMRSAALLFPNSLSFPSHTCAMRETLLRSLIQRRPGIFVVIHTLVYRPEIHFFSLTQTHTERPPEYWRKCTYKRISFTWNRHIVRVHFANGNRAHSRAFNVQRSFIVFDIIHGAKRSHSHIRYMFHVHARLFLMMNFRQHQSVPWKISHTHAYIQTRTPWCFFW